MLHYMGIYLLLSIQKNEKIIFYPVFFLKIFFALRNIFPTLAVMSVIH